MGNYHRASYHSSSPRWRNGFNSEGNFIGIEFEVDSPNYRTVLNLLPDFPPEHRPLTEIDGSLGPNGVEIIFPPISLNQLKRANCHFHTAIAAIKDVVQHNNRTGMHMNVNTRGWHSDSSTLMCIIINHMEEEHLSNIGGRNLTAYCHQYKNQRRASYRPGTARHTVADNKANRIELRFPVSTCDKSRIDNLVDFIERISAYCKKDAATKLAKEEAKVTKEKNPWSGLTVSVTNHHYNQLVADFYAFLSKTKKGRSVLEALHTAPPDMAEEPEYHEDDDDDDNYSSNYDEDDDEY